MDPRTDYVEVASLVTGTVSEGLSPQERLRLQRPLATSPEYLQERVSFILDHFGPKAMELTYVVAKNGFHSVQLTFVLSGPEAPRGSRRPCFSTMFYVGKKSRRGARGGGEGRGEEG